MNVKKILFSLSICTALSMPAMGMARSRVSTNAGCGQEFKGNKSTIKNCRSCLKKGGYYKKSASRKTWSCKVKSAKKVTKTKTPKVNSKVKPTAVEHIKPRVKREKTPQVKKVMARSDARSREDLKHLENMAKIDRIRTLAKENDNKELLAKADVLSSKENKRHEKKLGRIKAKESK